MIQKRDGEMHLPCGCVLWNEGDAFVFVPHSLDCPYYRYALEEAKRQGKDIEMREFE